MDNSKIAVIYKSKYGSTRRYAEWIAKALNAECFEASKISAEKLASYDVIVYGGALYVVGILGFSLIKRNYNALRDKKIFVFSVGATPPRPKALEEIKSHNFTAEMKDKIQYFHLRGAFDRKNLSFLDKFLMKLLIVKIRRKKEDLNEDEKGMLAVYKRSVDWTSKKNIVPLIEAIKKQQS